jgi:hypothetical protein
LALDFALAGRQGSHFCFTFGHHHQEQALFVSLPSFTMPWLLLLRMIIWVIGLLLSSLAVVSNAQTEDFIEGFKKPANLFSITNTPWIVVSEYSDKRDEPGNISLLNVNTLQRQAFSSLPMASQLSDFANPGCTPRSLNQLSPQGIEGRQLTNGNWEIAVVNHFTYESIEFFELNVLASPRPWDAL